MLDDYYSRLAALNSNPEVLKSMSDDNKGRLKEALTSVQSKLDGSEEDVKQAIENFITTFNDLKIDVELPEAGKTRSIMPKTETSLPRQILNDVTSMTLNML
jgi:hypothetical protein